MILLRWTGLGWLWLPIFVVSLGTAAAVASAVGSEGAGRDPVPILVAMAVVLALSPVQWFVGTALNSKAGPDGDRHTVMDAPMEYTAIGQAGVAVALAALVVGQLVSAWGWALFGGILVSALVAVLVVQERRRLRRRLDAVSDRERVARANGWQYRPRDAGLMMRWKETFGRRTYAMAPFGIIEGEYDGLPFTVFDTQVPRRPDVVEAICVLHLPVSYPTIRVDADWLSVVPTPEQFARAFDGRPGKGPDPLLVDMMLSKHRIDPDSIRFTPPGSDFGRELLTPAVRGLMVRHGLRAWRIQGQDLISEGPMRAASLPATDLLRYVAVVVELARAIPAGLAHRYGTP